MNKFRAWIVLIKLRVSAMVYSSPFPMAGLALCMKYTHYYSCLCYHCAALRRGSKIACVTNAAGAHELSLETWSYQVPVGGKQAPVPVNDFLLRKR